MTRSAQLEHPFLRILRTHVSMMAMAMAAVFLEMGKSMLVQVKSLRSSHPRLATTGLPIAGQFAKKQSQFPSAS